MFKKISALIVAVTMVFAIPAYSAFGLMEKGEKFRIKNSPYEIKQVKYDKNSNTEELHLSTNDHKIDTSELEELARNIKNQIKARSGQEASVECEVEGKNLVECECKHIKGSKV